MNRLQGTILKADPRRRRVAFFLVVALIVSGVAGIILLQEFLRDAHTLALHAPKTAIHRVLTLLKVVIVLIVVSVLGFGIFLARLSLRTIRTQQFPPPGTRVIQDTPVMTGRSAQRRGWGLLIYSMTLIVGSVILPILSWRIVHMLSP